MCWRQAWAYATFGRGTNLTRGPLSQSKVQQQPLGVLADSSEGDHGRNKNKQMPSIDCRGDGKRRRPVMSSKRVCRRNCPTQLPRWPPEGRKGSETPPRLASHARPAHKSPSLLLDQDLVVNFATYTRVYTVFIYLFNFKCRVSD